MLDLSRVNAFVVVARHENVSRAAEELHISQSPLSRQIIALEESLGVRLFTRERKRLKLTADGRAFLADAQRLLSAAAAVERREPAPLSVGYVPAAVYTGVLPRDLSRWRRRAPELKVGLRAMRTAEQLAALAAGTLDVGYTHQPAPALPSALVAREPLLLASPRAGSAVELLSSLPLIWMPGARDEVTEACARIGATPDLRIEAVEPQVVLQLVAAGLGVSLVQASLRRVAPPGVRFSSLPSRFGLEVRVYRVSDSRRLPPPPFRGTSGTGR
jgi:DNA-binding transcriptional LysR family regulator